MERVQKLLSNAGFCSRRKAEELIAQGKVTVNNKRITLGDKATQDDDIRVSSKKVEFDRKRYIKLFKPRHVITSLTDPYHKKTVMDYAKDIPERVYPVGRLDFDAEGLIILTNDGDFANRIMHPSYELAKTYQADLREKITDSKLRSIKGRVKLKDGYVEVKRAELVDRNKNRVEIEIHEGRNKIVKRIFKELGLYVGKLRRVKLGEVGLGNLKPGGWKELTGKEKESLMNRRVMVFGTFDVLHPGHQNFFEQAKKHGKHLTAVVARDKTVSKVKGRPPKNDEHARLTAVQKNRLVDKAVLGSLKERYKAVDKEKPDVIALGHDQKMFVEGLTHHLEESGLDIPIVRLKPYKRDTYRSSLIRNQERTPRSSGTRGSRSSK